MKKKSTIPILFLCAVLFSCSQKGKEEYWIRFTDEEKDGYGYKNLAGDVMIPLGKYAICTTDTFYTYAIVASPQKGWIAIDRDERIKYQVFLFDNGPDYPSEGLFRMIMNDKIGYASATTGEVIIEPQFRCAFPFENGKAKVSYTGGTQSIGEYGIFVSDEWFYIDPTGKKAGSGIE